MGDLGVSFFRAMTMRAIALMRAGMRRRDRVIRAEKSAPKPGVYHDNRVPGVEGQSEVVFLKPQGDPTYQGAILSNRQGDLGARHFAAAQPARARLFPDGNVGVTVGNLDSEKAVSAAQEHANSLELEEVCAGNGVSMTIFLLISAVVATVLTTVVCIISGASYPVVLGLLGGLMAPVVVAAMMVLNALWRQRIHVHRQARTAQHLASSRLP